MDELINAKRYLVSYHNIKKEIDRIENVLKEIRGLIDEKTRFQMVYLHCRLRILAGKCLEIDGALQALPESERTVLRYRYILGYRWSDICEKTGYSLNRVMKIHTDALGELNLKDIRPLPRTCGNRP